MMEGTVETVQQQQLREQQEVQRQQELLQEQGLWQQRELRGQQQVQQQQELQGQQQQQQESCIKSVNLQCDEEFDEVLAESPSTSYNYLRQQQQQLQGKNTHHSTDNHLSINNGGMVDNSTVVDSPLFNKMKREWRSYGWYTSCEEMDEVRRREKVSKRKSVTSVHGTKVFYRCNNWRRTRCNFRMYAIIFTSNKMCLFASGEHDHTTKDPYYITGITSQSERDPDTSTTQQDIHTQFVINANNPSLNSIPEQGETLAPQIIVSCIRDMFLLTEEAQITGMLQLATEINHKFTYIQRNNEFCFEPNDPALQGRSVVLLDCGSAVVVIERYNGAELCRETWKKGRWSQFLWAIRGKCMRISYQDFREPARL